MKFRNLKPEEIEVRVGQIGDQFMDLLLYKDARVDMRLLDEEVGPLNWKREHSRDNANCTVSIWDESKSQWVSKEDTGTKSNTEAEKGMASDSFKRACTNWGIGRGLYSAPQVRIWLKDNTVKISTTKAGKKTTYDILEVEKIAYNDSGDIIGLAIVNKSLKCRAFVWQKKESKDA